MATNGIYSRSLRLKEYELTDHLGNVRAVVGDYRQSDGTNPVWVALLRYYNQYVFGLDMPLMTWQGTGGGYRYGYNGKEMDRGFANNYDYGFRIYNAGIAKFLSVDPLISNFPFFSSYQFAANSPTSHSDLDGLESHVEGTAQTLTKVNPKLVIVNRQLTKELAKQASETVIKNGGVVAFENASGQVLKWIVGVSFGVVTSFLTCTPTGPAGLTSETAYLEAYRQPKINPLSAEQVQQIT